MKNRETNQTILSDAQAMLVATVWFFFCFTRASSAVEMPGWSGHIHDSKFNHEGPLNYYGDIIRSLGFVPLLVQSAGLSSEGHQCHLEGLTTA